MVRWGMVIDLNRCVGCYSCIIACKQEHFLPPDILWSRLLISEAGEYPTVTKEMYPVQCNHCKNPKCVEVCPTGATIQREDGIVWIDNKRCMGCRYCVIACPYQSRVFLSNANSEKEYFPGQGLTEFEKIGRRLCPHELGTVVKCDFCVERIEAGLKKGLTPGVDREATPACVIACPAKARYFGDLDDPHSEVSRLVKEKKATPLHPEYGTEPSIYYITR